MKIPFITPPQESTGAEGSDEQSVKTLLIQTVFVAAIIGFGYITYSWMASDITGEYASNDQRMGTITLSIVRKATTLHSNLSFGQTSLLEYNGPSVAAAHKLHWIFSVPQRWLDRGHPQRRVVFDGQVASGIASGTITDGKLKVKVKLVRNGIASMYRMMQSHVPWAL